MANMSYCMFENTYGDLRDCLEAVYEADSLKELTSQMSEEELTAFKAMKRLCQKFIDAVNEAEVLDEFEGLDEEDDEG
jgi:rhamnose utilization protein RhaD (predicted bifunctional aldolase and dehydrogenase)